MPQHAFCVSLWRNRAHPMGTWPDRCRLMEDAIARSPATRTAPPWPVLILRVTGPPRPVPCSARSRIPGQTVTCRPGPAPRWSGTPVSRVPTSTACPGRSTVKPPHWALRAHLQDLDFCDGSVVWRHPVRPPLPHVHRPSSPGQRLATTLLLITRHEGELHQTWVLVAVEEEPS